MLREMAVMALVLGGLAVPARAQDVIRLFAPVPAGKVVLPPSAGRTAYLPPRPLVVRPSPLMRGSLKDGEATDRPITPVAKAPWLVAPQTTPDTTHTTVAPSAPTDDGPALPPRVIRNAAR